MTFKPSYSGIGRLLRGPEMQVAMVHFAEKAKVVAEGIAPVDKTGPHPGRYKAGFSVSSGVRRGVRGGPRGRAYARLTNSSPEAVFVEYGTKNNPAHHTLLNSLAFLHR